MRCSISPTSAGSRQAQPPIHLCCLPRHSPTCRFALLAFIPYLCPLLGLCRALQRCVCSPVRWLNLPSTSRALQPIWTRRAAASSSQERFEGQLLLWRPQCLASTAQAHNLRHARQPLHSGEAACPRYRHGAAAFSHCCASPLCRQLANCAASQQSQPHHQPHRPNHYHPLRRAYLSSADCPPIALPGMRCPVPYFITHVVTTP